MRDSFLSSLWPEDLSPCRISQVPSFEGCWPFNFSSSRLHLGVIINSQKSPLSQKISWDLLVLGTSRLHRVKIQVSTCSLGFSCGSDGKKSTCNAGDPGSISGLGISLGEGNGNPLQYSCLKNYMTRGAWQAI